MEKKQKRAERKRSVLQPPAGGARRKKNSTHINRDDYHMGEFDLPPAIAHEGQPPSPPWFNKRQQCQVSQLLPKTHPPGPSEHSSEREKLLARIRNRIDDAAISAADRQGN